MLENFLFRGVFKCSKENNGQSFFKNLNSPRVGKCQAPKGAHSSIQAGFLYTAKRYQEGLDSSVRKWGWFGLEGGGGVYNLKRKGGREGQVPEVATGQGAGNVLVLKTQWSKRNMGPGDRRAAF